MICVLISVKKRFFGHYGDLYLNEYFFMLGMSILAENFTSELQHLKIDYIRF